MHPFLQAQLAALHQNDLQAEAEAVRGHNQRSRAAKGRDAQPIEVVIRRTTAADGPALAALSALDAAPMPFGPALVAEVAGVPRAVLPLDGGRPFGDPFVRTDELVALLELRAAQIGHERETRNPRRGRLAWMTPAALRRLV
ncbi:MAG: hypothetical protein QOF65_701 [Thermoleophilaceae bacterium]|jgi:hypothetical protein|nr:hypothetical protein [Thermoleophilaceae bacterium]MEA2436145.1 hypothetical protein [Thermoleophilaceae bacterium]